MTTKHALKKLAANGIVCLEPKTTEANYTRHFVAIANGKRAMISTQGEDISLIRVARVNDQDDILSDYFAGYFVETIPQLLRALAA